MIDTGMTYEIENDCGCSRIGFLDIGKVLDASSLTNGLSVARHSACEPSNSKAMDDARIARTLGWWSK